MIVEDDFTQEALEARLAGCALAKTIYLHESVESTSTVLQQLAAAGAPQGTVVIADRQTAGRGRRGRTWHSPPGVGLWFSTLLKPPASENAAWAATVCASLGVLRGVLTTTQLHPGIQWPNDLVIGGKKVCGILTDVKATAEGSLDVVVGIGINVNMAAEDFPEEFRDRATSLSAYGGHPVSRAALFEATMRGFAEAYAVVGREGLSVLLQPWRMHSATLGTAVRVEMGERVIEGVAADILESGALIVRLANGLTEAVVAGDVTTLRTRVS